MFNLGLPIPPGFSITVDGYEYFLESSELKEKIYSMLNNLDVEDTKELEQITEKIRGMIEKAEIPKDLAGEITIFIAIGLKTQKYKFLFN